MCFAHKEWLWRTFCGRSFRAAHIPSCTRHTHRMPCHSSMNRYTIYECMNVTEDTGATKTYTHRTRSQWRRRTIPRAVYCVLSRFNHFVECATTTLHINPVHTHTHTIEYGLRVRTSHCHTTNVENFESSTNGTICATRGISVLEIYCIYGIVFGCFGWQLVHSVLCLIAINLKTNRHECKRKSGKRVSGEFGPVIDYITCLTFWRFCAINRHSSIASHRHFEELIQTPRNTQHTINGTNTSK